MDGSEPVSPQLGLASARVATVALFALALAAAALFAVGSIVMLRAAPAVRVLSEFGILVPHGGEFPGAVLIQPPTAEARVAGFTGPARLIAVDGRPVARPLTADGLAAMLGEEAGQVSLTIAPEGGRPRAVLLTRSADHAHEVWNGTLLTENGARLLQWLVQFVYLLVGFAAAFLLLRRRSRDPVVLLFIFQAIVFTATSSVGWQASYALDLYPPVRFADGLANLAALALLFLFPDGRIDGWFRRALCALILGNFTIHFLLDVFHVEVPLLARHGMDAIAMSANFAGLPILYAKYRAVTDQLKRQQLKAAMLGISISSILAATVLPLANLAEATSSIPVALFAGLSAGIVSTISSIVLALGFLVALLRYKLYDADQAISRSFAYGALTIGLLGIFTGTEKIMELLGEEYFHESIGTLAGGIGAAAAAVMLVPLHHRISHWAEHHFQKDLIRLRHGLPLLVGDLRETAGADRIVAAVLDAVTSGVRATRAALVANDIVQDARGIEAHEAERWCRVWTPAAHDGVDCVPSDPLFPMRIPLDAEGHGRVGWLLVGPRPDGSLYGKDEREALEEIADPVARALEIVRAREARERETQERLRDKDETISRLARKFAELEESIARLANPTPDAGKPLTT